MKMKMMTGGALFLLATSAACKKSEPAPVAAVASTPATGTGAAKKTATATDAGAATATATDAGDAGARVPSELERRAANVFGRHCFALVTKTLKSDLELEVKGAEVTGSGSATVQNPKESYFTSYRYTIRGVRKDDKVHVNLTTKIENDTQRTSEVWTWKGGGDLLETGQRRGDTYRRVPCSKKAAPSDDEE